MEKFVKQKITAKGEKRGYVDLGELKTLWFNTGTQCNLSCTNCYIESSPTNDRLVYITEEEVQSYLKEVLEKKYPTARIGLTGGEPFINPHIMGIIRSVLSAGFDILILTNALNPINKHLNQLLELNDSYPNKIELRVSLDHYTEEVHERERGKKTFVKALKRVKNLVDSGFTVAIAGRSLLDEDDQVVMNGYQNLLNEFNIDLKLSKSNLVIFSEMEQESDVPEITVDCWGILDIKPENQMCASERMVVKRRGDELLTVLPCTILAYDTQFDLGHTLEESEKRVYLNHEYCAKFCVLGGSSCSAT